MSALYNVCVVNQPYEDPTINVSMNIGFNNFRPDDKCTAITHICDLINNYCREKKINVWYRSNMSTAFHGILNSITILNDFNKGRLYNADFSTIINSIANNILAITAPVETINVTMITPKLALDQAHTIVDLFRSDELLTDEYAEHIKDALNLIVEFTNNNAIKYAQKE